MARRSSRIAVNDHKREMELELVDKVRGETPAGLVLVDAGEMGRGVATTRKYKAGELVSFYSGELVSQKEAIKRYIS